MAFVHHAARSLTGGTATSLDALLTADLATGTHYCWTANESEDRVYLHVFDASATDAESSPDVIRPDDYATAGVWVLQSSPFDVSAGVEAGSLQTFFVETPPTGYLELDGSAVSRTTYSDLFAVIGTLGGIGDGVNTFELPDTRGETLRGWDHGAGNDPDAASRTDAGDGTTTGDHVGTHQGSQNKAHSHTMYSSYSDNGNGAGVRNTTGNAYLQYTTSSGGTEARGRNIAVMFCIKY